MSASVVSSAHRIQTRRQRYDLKVKTAQRSRISVCAVNFGCDENLGYLIRAAACFGVTTVHVIGNVPERKYLVPVSGSLIDYVTIVQYSNPHSFLEAMRTQNVSIVAAELSEGAISVHDYDFDTMRDICIAVGNEHSGVPAEILHNSDVVYIPMPGVGFCLNTAQTANIMLFEFNRQQYERKASEHLRAG